MLVRPTSPQDGQLLFKFEWDKVKLSLRVTSAMSGEFVCTVPGRWGPRATFWKAAVQPKPVYQHRNDSIHIAFLSTADRTVCVARHWTLSLGYVIGCKRRLTACAWDVAKSYAL